MNLSCLKTTPDHLQQLFQGALTESEEDQEKAKGIWKCLDRSLEVFSKYTSGKKKESYEASELQTFANQFLGSSHEINDSFARSIFQLKTMVLGGSEENITKAELDQLRMNLKLFGEAIVPLAPKIKILITPKTYKMEEKAMALKELSLFAKKLAGIFSSSIHPMPWKVISQFTADLDQYLKAEETTALTNLYEQKDLLRYFKLFMVGGSDTEIEQDKWEPILTGLTSSVVTFLASTDNLESVEKINFHFTSNLEEQTRAVRELGVSLKQLLSNSKLKTLSRIKQVADYWIKVSVLMEVILPSHESGLSLELFLTDPDLRKLENSFVRKWFNEKSIEANRTKQSELITDGRDLIRLLNQKIISYTKKAPSFSVSRVKQLVENHLEFFQDQELGRNFLQGIPIFVTLHSLMNQTSEDQVPLADLDPVLTKALQFLAYEPAKSVSAQSKLEHYLQILKEKPTITSIQKKQILKLVTDFQPLIEKISGFAFTAEQLNRVVEAAFSLKGSLWNSSLEVLSSTDLDRMVALYSVYQSNHGSISKAILALNEEFSAPNFTPSLSVSALESIQQDQIHDLVGTLRIAQKLILQKSDDSLTLSELATIVSVLESQDINLILRPVLKGNAPITLTSSELHTLTHAAEILMSRPPQSLDKLFDQTMKLKSSLLGGNPTSLNRKELEFVSALLKVKSRGQKGVLEILNLLDRSGFLDQGTLHASDLEAFLTTLKDQNFKIENLDLYLSTIHEFSPFSLRLLSLQRLLEHPTIDSALALFLEIKGETEFCKEDLNQLINSASSALEKFGESKFDAKKYSKLVELVLNLKGTLFNSRKDLITRSEIETILTVFKIKNGKTTPEKKAKAIARLIETSMKKPVEIRDLVQNLDPLLDALNLTRELPIPLAVDNLKRLKLLTVGGSNTKTLSPHEFSLIAQKALKGSAPSEFLNMPAFKLNSTTFLWLESALSLAVQSGKEIGLKDAYAAIGDYFEKNRTPLKHDLSRSFYGIWYHVLEGKKGPLPFAVLTRSFELNNDSKIESHHIKVFLDLIRNIRIQLQDLEAARTLDRKKLLERLKTPTVRSIVQNSAPLLQTISGSPTLVFSSAHQSSRAFEFHELAYRIVVRKVLDFIFKQYNSANGQPMLQSQDLALLISDLRDPMIEFGLLYKSGNPFEAAKKQLKVINLFTRTGNGNDWLEVDETLEFMTMSHGMSATLARMLQYLSSHCIKRDVAGLPGFEGQCVIKNLFTKNTYSNLYAQSIPGMNATYQSMNAQNKIEFELGTLRLTGKNLFHEKDRSIFEVFDDRTLSDYGYVDFDLDMLQSLNSVHPLIESVFQTMDTNHDQRIQLKEALDLFPKFCPALKTAAKGKVGGSCANQQSSKELNALFGYLLVYKEKPGISFMLWKSDWADYVSGKTPFPSLSRYDLFKILSNLSI